MIPQIHLAQHILQIFGFHGIENIVICPGSRNAPLTIGFANNPFFKCYSIVDERCAAFFALGMAQEIKQPVAVVCTSGSALLNFYPAIAEAFYNQIPLIIVSADRPKDKIDIGDGQTIRQKNVFENHVLEQVNLPENPNETSDFEIQKAIETCFYKKGPIHVNVPFEEPLYNTILEYNSYPQFINLKKENQEYIEANSYIEIIKNSSKVLILIGNLSPNTIATKIIDLWASLPNYMVMTETLSNINHDQFISKIDVTITSFTIDEMIDYQPDVLITMGGMIVSKKVKNWLRSYPPKFHFHIDELRAYNTFNCLSYHFKCSINHFWKKIKIESHIKSDYQNKFLALKEKRAENHLKFVENIDFSDFKVFNFIEKNIPKGIQLQISNSAAIRYIQLFDYDKSIEMYCNRGTSGIDGSTSTAIGASIFAQKPVWLITGDLSFFYDSNALWNNYIPTNFKIVIINNGGGGIFRILPGHQENEVFNHFFETQHQLNASHLARMYQFEYFSVHNEKELEERWCEFVNSNQKSILEIFTPIQKNEKILKNYFNSL
ncbi:MAG: 2-succinyl-5-enolpyruvyl-6-hydroxy-3-cyclohexene-1-carboxylic-acid synthase [Flavobacterium sp.]